jgi:DNA primase
VRTGLDPGQFTIHNVLDRFEKVGDLFEPVLSNKQKIEAALEKTSQLL